MPTDFSQEFQLLAERFEEIPANGQGNQGLYLRTIATGAAKTVKRCQEAGRLALGDIEWPAAGSMSFDQGRELHWYCLWVAFCNALQRNYPDDLPENVLLMEPIGKELAGNDGVYQSCGESWQRARGYAAVCRLLGRLCDDRAAVVPNTMPPPLEKDDVADDPVSEILTGQKLDLYRLLTATPHWVNYRTLADEDCHWKETPPESHTVQRGLKKLQSALSNLSHGPSLKIDHEHQRAKLIPPGT